VSLTQLIEQCIIICRGRCSNSRYPTYPPYKMNSINEATWLKKKLS